jgi:hypothetical protein
VASKDIIQPPDQLGQFALAPHERAALGVHCGPGRRRLLHRYQVESRVLGKYRPLELA